MLASHGILRHDHSQRRAWIPRLAVFHREQAIADSWRSGSNLDSEAGSFIERGDADRLPSGPQASIKKLASSPAATWRARPRPRHLV